MKVVAPQDLELNVVYRIHYNVNPTHDPDWKGTYVGRDAHNFPLFSNRINRQRHLSPAAVSIHPGTVTFYESGDTLQRKENTIKLLERVFGTKHHGKEYFGGRKRKRTRRNKRV
jgi:hypothetical protein